MLNERARQASGTVADDSEPESESETSVRIDELVKIFEESSDDKVVAVDGISIHVVDGEFLVLVGPSGCGKTTTLRSVAGLETPTEGNISINGTDVTGLDPRERDISMVFQNYALYPHKTIRENISFPLEVRNYREDEIESRVEETAKLLDISELLDRKPNQLSGGQQQRVALGRAIVRQPSVFLMDEPLSNLDAKLRVQMRTELNELHKRLDKSTIYVTHDQAEAMTLGDRVAVMNDGTIQQIDPPQTLYDHPANKFVASFIGEPPMNFFPVECRETESGYRVVSDLFDFELPESIVRDLNAWDGAVDSVIFGIRPEDISDVEQLTVAETENDFDAHVKVVEPMGSDTVLTLRPPDGETEFTAAVAPETNAAEGKLITLALNLEKSHLFDEKTGENITR